MSMSKFASYADYAASISKDTTLQRLQAMNAELQAEAQQKRQAAMWQRLQALTLDELRIAACRAPSMAAFLNTFES